MKLFGYTLGQALAIGFIALLFLFAAKTIDNRVNIPGFHTLVQGA